MSAPADGRLAIFDLGGKQRFATQPVVDAGDGIAGGCELSGRGTVLTPQTEQDRCIASSISQPSGSPDSFLNLLHEANQFFEVLFRRPHHLLNAPAMHLQDSLFSGRRKPLPSDILEFFFVQAEMVADFVQDGIPDLRADLFFTRANPPDVSPEQEDDVGHRAARHHAAVAERYALVQPENRFPFWNAQLSGRMVFYHHLHIAHVATKLPWEAVERLLDQLVEPFSGNPHQRASLIINGREMNLCY